MKQVEEISQRLTHDVLRQRTTRGDPRFHLAAAAAEVAELLRHSPYATGSSFEKIERLLEQVSSALPLDAAAKELLALVKQAKALQ